MRKILLVVALLMAMAGKAAAATDCEKIVAAQLAMEEKALSLICAGKTNDEVQVELDAYMKKAYPQWTFGPYPFEMTRFLIGYGACTKGLSPLRKNSTKMLAEMCEVQHWDLSTYRANPTEKKTPAPDAKNPVKP